MNFDIKDMPYAQFEKLGMSRKDVLAMRPEDLASLLSGNRTSLLTFSIDLGNGQKFETDAKLSLYRNLDNSLSLQVHPVRAQVKNDIGATSEEMERLKKGELLVRDYTALNGEKEKHFFQLDPQTNEILRARVRDFVVPGAIRDVVLSPDMKELLRQGRAVELEAKGGAETIHVRVDLNEPRGISVKPAVPGQNESRGIGSGSDQVKPSGPKR